MNIKKLNKLTSKRHIRKIYEFAYFNTVAMCWTHKNFWNNFFTLIIYSRCLHHNCCGSKHQKQKRVHVEQCSEVAVFDGTADNNKIKHNQ